MVCPGLPKQWDGLRVGSIDLTVSKDPPSPLPTFFESGLVSFLLLSGLKTLCKREQE